VIDVTASNHAGSFVFSGGQITWDFKPGTAPNSINYEITGTVLPDPGNEPKVVGTF